MGANGDGMGSAGGSCQVQITYKNRASAFRRLGRRIGSRYAGHIVSQTMMLTSEGLYKNSNPQQSRTEPDRSKDIWTVSSPEYIWI